MAKSTSKISDVIPKADQLPEQAAVNIKVDRELYEKLKAKLKKDRSSVHGFFVALAQQYLGEK